MTVEVDFDVYKELTYRRETEEMTHSDVLRRLLSLAPRRNPILRGRPWAVEDFYPSTRK